MSTLGRFAGVIVGLVLGSVVGFLVGRSDPLGSRDLSTGKSDEKHQNALPNGAEPSARPPSLNRTGAEAAAPGPAWESLDHRLREIVALGPPARRDYEFEIFLGRVGVADLPLVLAAVQDLPANPLRLRLLSRLFRRWGELSGPAVLETASHLIAGERMRAQSAALEGWAGRDPQGAWTYAKEMLAANPAQGGVALSALRQLAKVNLAQALAESTVLNREITRSTARIQIIDDALDLETMDSLVQAAQTLPPGVERDAWITAAFNRWAALDSDAPLAALRLISDESLARSAMHGLLRGWSELDPVGAVTYALEHRADPLAHDALGQVLESAVRHPGETEVREMMAKVMEAGELDSLFGGVVFPLASSHPRLAVELAGQLSDEYQRINRMSQALVAWAHNDLHAAAAHYERLPPGEMKTKVFVNIAYPALENERGAEMIVRWLSSFSEADRVASVGALVGRMEASTIRIPAGNAAIIARVVAETPGLSDEVRQRAEKYFGPPR